MGSTTTRLFVQRYADVVLAAVVLGMIGMMIVPLPTFVLDLLLSLNITTAVVLLLVSLYVPQALRISAFPSILLLTTLFRLALNVSSTRLILLQADAGEVIDAFGNFVVQGNYVVGAVVFLILTIVQFLVVAKGAERVSEVAARFTLDAMPGKQMAIDADLRTGAFGMDEARRRRSEVQRESQLYGAMDGAMKFVKGDAIAGVIITTINVVAGMVIGVVQLEMPAGEAARTYTILTIGDGLVSQIPALLIAITAGIIVTRVASEDGDTDLGADIARQILEHPRAISIAAGLLLVLALVPGLPTGPFLLMGLAAGFIAWSITRTTDEEADDAAEAEVEGVVRSAARQSRALVPAVTPLAVDVGADLTGEISEERWTWLEEMTGTLRDAIFHELGVKLPAARLRRSGACATRQFVVAVDEVPVETREMPPGVVLAALSPNEAASLGVEAVETRNPATNQVACWVPVAASSGLEADGVSTWDGAGYVLLELTAAMRRHASKFVVLQHTQNMLDQVEGPYPAAVHEVVPKVVGVQGLTEVLRRLVAEGLSIRNLSGILQTLADRAGASKDPIVLTELVREGMSRYITHKYARADGTLAVYLIDREIEEMVAGAVRTSEEGTYLALPPEVTREILEAVTDQVRSDVEVGRTPVLLTDRRARRYLARLVSLQVPDVVVLAFQELEPSLQVQPLGRIEVGTATSG